MRTGLFIMLAVLLGACSGGSGSDTETKTEVEAPWDAQLELKDKARQANELIEQRALDAQRAIEEQTQ